MPPSWAARRAGARPASSTRRARRRAASWPPSAALSTRIPTTASARRSKFLPHVLGSAQAVTGPLTSWSSIARHSRLVVLFGGANPKNMQVAKGGCGEHAVGGWMAELARAGVEVVNVSPIRDDGPEAAGANWIPIRPNTDTAMMLALAHTLVAEGLHDEAFLERYARASSACAPLPDGRDRRPAEGRRLGRARSPASTPRRSARWRAAWRRRAP